MGSLINANIVFLQKNNVPIPPVKSRPTAAIFNDDDEDEEPEEMPPEARMRMRNIGR